VFPLTAIRSQTNYGLAMVRLTNISNQWGVTVPASFVAMQRRIEEGIRRRALTRSQIKSQRKKRQRQRKRESTPASADSMPDQSQSSAEDDSDLIILDSESMTMSSGGED